MKNKIFLILALAIMAVPAVSSGQSLFTKNDSLSVANDSIIKLVIPQYRGNINWQHSPDGQNWRDLPAEFTDTLRVNTNMGAMYRAVVTEGNCLPVYSDSAVVIIPLDTLSPWFLTPADSGLVLVSDSTDLAGGVYQYFIDTTSFSGIEPGSVIIDESSGGTIRRVTGVTETGDTITVITEQATMEDLFFDASFKLSTDMIEPATPLKGARLKDIEKALTDDDGFIHPVEMVYHTRSGKMLKSAVSSAEEEPGNLVDNLYMYEDFTGRDLYYYANGTDLSEKKYDKEGNLIYDYEYTDAAEVRLYVKEGYFEFNPVLKFEFDFVAPKFDWKNLNFNKGELTRFKFYSDASSVDFKCIVALDASYEMNAELFKKLKNDLVKVSFKFIVGGVPVWVDVNVDIFMKVSASLNAELHASAGFQSKHTLTMGVGYENKEWYDIMEYTPENTIFPLQYEGHANWFQRFEVYPRMDVKIYSLFGPNLEIIPFIEDEVNMTLEGNWDAWLDLGLDTRVGCEVGILGKTLYEYQSDKIRLFRTRLYEVPSTLEPVSGDGQTGLQGGTLPLPVVLQVKDNRGSPCELIPVYFETTNGTLDDYKVFTDAEGKVSVKWTLGATEGTQQLTAYLKDGRDQVKDDSYIIITSTALTSNLEGIFTDSRDGSNYRWVQIGSQVWMAENLAWLPAVSPPSEDSSTDPVYYVYGYDASDIDAAKATGNYSTYGVLYNWPAALTACPTGWHLPSDADWKQLEMALGMTQAQADEAGYHGTDQGAQMKTTSGWSINDNGTNTSGFSALPGGYRDDNGYFDIIGDYGNWWSSTEYSPLTAWYRALYCSNTFVYRWYDLKDLGFSVRCVRDL